MPKLLTALVAATWLAGQSTSLAPFVATPEDVVDRMLTLARTGRIDKLSGGLCKSDDFEAVKERMATFMAAGLTAICSRSQKDEA